MVEAVAVCRCADGGGKRKGERRFVSLSHRRDRGDVAGEEEALRRRVVVATPRKLRCEFGCGCSCWYTLLRRCSCWCCSLVEVRVRMCSRMWRTTVCRHASDDFTPPSTPFFQSQSSSGIPALSPSYRPSPFQCDTSIRPRASAARPFPPWISSRQEVAGFG